MFNFDLDWWRITLRYSGFIEFDDPRDAEDACYELNGQKLVGERVTVEMSEKNRGRGGRSRSRSRGVSLKFRFIHFRHLMSQLEGI